MRYPYYYKPVCKKGKDLKDILKQKSYNHARHIDLGKIFIAEKFRYICSLRTGFRHNSWPKISITVLKRHCKTTCFFFRIVRKIAKKRLLSMSFLSVRKEQFGSKRTRVHETWYLRTFQKSVDKIQVSLKSEKHKGFLHKNLCKLMIKSRRVIVGMRNVSKRTVLCSVQFSRKTCIYEIV